MAERARRHEGYVLRFQNGKEYVGITNNYQTRIKNHRCSSINSKLYLYRLWRKHGEPTRVLKVLFKSFDEASDWEKATIYERRTKAPKGCNLTNGGEGIIGLSRERLVARNRKVALAYDTQRRRANAKKRWVEPSYRERVVKSMRMAQAAMSSEEKSARVRLAHSRLSDNKKERRNRALAKASRLTWEAKSPSEREVVSVRARKQAFDNPDQRYRLREYSQARSLEQKREQAKKRLVSMTPEKRREASRKAHAALTHEQRSERSKKGHASRSPGAKAITAEKQRAYMLTKTPQQKAESASKRLAHTTPEQRSESASKGWAKMTPAKRRLRIEQQINHMAMLTKDQRSARYKKAWETRRRNGNTERKPWVDLGVSRTTWYRRFLGAKTLGNKHGSLPLERTGL